MARNRDDYEYASDYIEDALRRRKRRHRLAVGLILALILAFAVWFCSYYRVRYVTVEGSTRYTDDEIKDYALRGFLGDNTVVLSWRYQHQKIADVPFIEAMDVDVITHDTIHIRVYEKSLAGYVNYLGRYFYFDRNGMVVESSTEKIEGVPEVTGLTFDHIALNEVLPVADSDVFSKILETVQLLSKYGLSADRIYVGTADQESAYFGNVCVNLGADEYMDEKISNLAQILPSLTGKSGTLDMTSFTADTNYVTFTEDGRAQSGSGTASTEQTPGTAADTESAESADNADGAADAQRGNAEAAQND